MYGYLYCKTSYQYILGHTDTCNYFLHQLRCRLHVDNHDPYTEMFFDSSRRHSPAAAASSVGDPDPDGGLQHLDSEIFMLLLIFFFLFENFSTDA